MVLGVSDTDIKVFNAALAYLGIPEVESFVEGSATAATGNRLYSDALEEILAMYPWRFTMERGDLVRTADTPPEPWEGMYQLPSTAKNVRAVQIDGFNAKFDVYGRLVAVMVQDTSTATVSADYSVMVTPSQWPGYFRQAFVLHLAARLAMPLTMDFDFAAQLDQRAQYQLAKAKNMDAQGRTQSKIDTKAFIRARRGGRG